MWRRAVGMAVALVAATVVAGPTIATARASGAAAQVPPSSTTTTVGTTTTTTTEPAGRLTVEPVSGGTGAAVVVVGTGCMPPDSDLRVSLLAPSGDQGRMADGRTDGSGSFTVTTAIPPFVFGFLHAAYPSYVLPGPYEIVVGPVMTPSDYVSVRCSTPFEVTSGGPGPLVISPTSGPAGSTIAITTGCPYPFGARLRAEVDGVTLPGTEVQQNVRADATVAMTLPRDIAPGTLVAIAGSCANATYAPATFTVTAVAEVAVEGTSTSPVATPVAAQPQLTG